MKKFIEAAAAMLLLMAATVLAGCGNSDDTPAGEPQLDVTPHNMEGSWSVSLWNGHRLDEDSYVYLKLIRKDRTFELYENLGSFSTRKVTGEYNIYTDDERGAMIRGMYDYGNGDWSHRYVVTSLTASQMVWRAADDEDVVTVYERVESIPDHIVNARPEQ